MRNGEPCKVGCPQCGQLMQGWRKLKGGDLVIDDGIACPHCGWNRSREELEAELIRHQQYEKSHDWVSVEDFLPDAYGIVLIFYLEHYKNNIVQHDVAPMMAFASYHNGEWHINLPLEPIFLLPANCQVTHWRRLPEMPKVFSNVTKKGEQNE